MSTKRARGSAVAAGILWSSLLLVMLTAGSASAALGAVDVAHNGPGAGVAHASLVAPSLVVPKDPPSSPPQTVATVRVGLEPVAGAFDSASGLVYVANVFSDNLTVFNGTSIVAWINLPDATVEGPTYVTYDPLSHLVYVVDQTNFVTGGGAVSVIQGLSVIDTLYVGTFSNSAVLDPLNGYLYVTDSGTSYVSVINAAGTSVLANITVGTGPTSAAYDPADGSVYVANYDSANVTVISGLNVAHSLGAGTQPVSVAYDPADQDVYVANNGSANVTVYNGLSVVGNVPVGSHPEYAAYNPSVGGVEVASTNANTVSVLNGTALVATVGVVAAPVWLGVGPGDPYTFVAGSNASAVSVLNGANFVSNDPVGKRPTFGVADPFHALEYVIDSGSNAVTIFSGTYGVTFTESGLSPGTSWSVTLASSTNTSASTSIGFSELPGSYAYTIGTPSGYSLVGSVPPSPLAVTNASLSVAVTFAPISPSVYNLTFVESGLGCTSHWGHGWRHGGGGGSCCSDADHDWQGGWGHSGGGGGRCCGHSAPTNLTWSVTVAGVTQSTTGPSISFQETNGVYAYTIGAPSGYEVTSSVPSSPVTISGANLTVNVTFAPIVLLSITFQESGLSHGTTWCVTVGNTTECSTTCQMVFSGLSPGSYAFSVAPVNGYTVRPASGSVTLTTRNVTVQVTFSSPGHHCGG